MTILLLIIVLLLIAGLPTWPYSNGWGFGPSGVLGTVLLVLLVVKMCRRLPIACRRRGLQPRPRP